MIWQDVVNHHKGRRGGQGLDMHKVAECALEQMHAIDECKIRRLAQLVALCGIEEIIARLGEHARLRSQRDGDVGPRVYANRWTLRQSEAVPLANTDLQVAAGFQGLVDGRQKNQV